MTPSLASLEEEVRTLKEQLDEARGKAEGIQGLREEVQRRCDRNARWHGYFGPGNPKTVKIAKFNTKDSLYLHQLHLIQVHRLFADTAKA